MCGPTKTSYLEKPQQFSGPILESLVRAFWDDFDQLGLLAYELQFRTRVSRNRRAEVVERVLELAEGLRSAVPPEPGFEFPTTEIQEVRAFNRRKLDHVDWSKTGLLTLSDYHVGETNGLPEQRRRRLLNYIFLEDDLRDVDDPAYKASWGAPKTSDRLKKLADSIATFARNAKNHPNDLSRAIEEWEADLDYLKSTFYDDWGDFPWPDVEV